MCPCDPLGGCEGVSRWPDAATGYRAGDLATLLTPVSAAQDGAFVPSAVRVVLHADLEDADDPLSASPLAKQTWRSMWTAVNLFQGVALHVDRPGGHGMPPPEADEPGKKGARDAWDLLEDVDESLADVVAVLRAEGAPAPDAVGLDLMDGARTVGQAELAWTDQRLAVSFGPCPAPGWTVIEAGDDDLDAAGVADLAARVLSHLSVEATA